MLRHRYSPPRPLPVWYARQAVTTVCPPAVTVAGDPAAAERRGRSVMERLRFDDMVSVLITAGILTMLGVALGLGVLMLLRWTLF